MKNKFLGTLFIVALLISVLISVIFTMKKNEPDYKQGDVNVVFSSEDTGEVTLPTGDFNQSSIEVTTEVFEESSEEEHSEVVEEITVVRNPDLVIDFEAFDEVIIELFKLSRDNLSVLETAPLTESYFNTLIEKKNIIPTVSKGSELNIYKLGVSENEDTFMVMFSTQTSNYYITGTIVDGQIDSIDYKELK